MWNYYRDEPNYPPFIYDDPLTVNYNADHIKNSESFKYKSIITRKTSNGNQKNDENTEQWNKMTKKNLQFVVPLKHLSIFQRTLDMPLINCEVSLTLTLSENSVLTEITTQTATAAQWDNPAKLATNAPTNVACKIIDTKFTNWRSK